MDPAMRRHALWIARAMARTDLSPLRAEDVAHLERICEVRHLEEGEVLVRAQTEVSAVHVVRSGEIHLAARKATGGRQLVGLCREGAVVADIPLFCERPMPFDALAGRRSTTLQVPRDRLIELLQHSPTLSLRWTTSVAQRLEQTQRRLVGLLTQDLTTQFATLLLEERETDPEGRLLVRLSHATIAQLLGVRRQSVSRVASELRRRGLISGGYREIRLDRPDELARMAGIALDAAHCADAPPPQGLLEGLGSARPTR